MHQTLAALTCLSTDKIPTQGAAAQALITSSRPNFAIFLTVKLWGIVNPMILCSCNINRHFIVATALKSVFSYCGTYVCMDKKKKNNRKKRMCEVELFSSHPHNRLSSWKLQVSSLASHKWLVLWWWQGINRNSGVRNWVQRGGKEESKMWRGRRIDLIFLSTLRSVHWEDRETESSYSFNPALTLYTVLSLGSSVFPTCLDWFAQSGLGKG